MDLNVLSPDQLNSVRLFRYKPIYEVSDPLLNVANEDLKDTLTTMRKQNRVLEEDVSSLQTLLDTIYPTKARRDPELIEEIKWNQYYYKKYTYQIHLLWVIIGICILLNLFASFLSPVYFPIVAGIILAVSFIYIGYQLWDFMMRDPINFDEYTFYEYTGNSYRPDESTLKIKPNCVVRDLTE